MRLRHQDYPKKGHKRRDVKRWARQWIRYSLSRYGVKRIKDIPCDFHYEQCITALLFLGYRYDYSSDKKASTRHRQML